ncbi:related to acyl-CoA synthetase [Fusarium torulosum]|uniref:Related to acyl-CoA synthetase n=1 Tax=Fusarium torulosum TaxID=33205 RepID=A0AAE8LY82_9HYPO|nr:related to acyl-CoA synthetase [Fusarium torulosum]
MVFTASPSTPPLPFEPPRGLTLDEFLFSDKYAHLRVRRSSEALVCGLSGRVYSTDDLEENASLMARALAQELGWQQEQDQESGRHEERVVALYSANAMDFLVVTLALHRLGAAALLIHPTSTAAEFKQHLLKVRADAVFTCAPLLAECLTACDGEVLKARTYILDLPGTPADQSFTSSSQLLEIGRQAPELPPRGPASPKTAAFYFASSGTSGLQKLVKVSHYNVISNVLQSCAFENRKATGEKLDRMLGLLPLSHAFALVVACVMLYRGDTIVLLPKFDMQQMLKSVQVHRINRLYLVPPVVAALAKNPFLLNMFDLSTVENVVLGAALLDGRIADQMRALCPHWALLQGYGVTEAAVVIACSKSSDLLLGVGSSGTLLPGIEARLEAADGQEVTDFDTVGELCIRSPSVVEGYVDDDAANQATFTADGWLRTGDMAVFRQSPATSDAHLCIVDRMKDLIKVYGLQVSPAAIEAELLSHPAVAQAAVIRVADDASGEVPRAIIVLQPDALKGLEEAGEDGEEALKDSIAQVIEERMSTSHWLKGGIVFVESIPVSPAGKVLKKVLREQHGTR